MLIGDVAQFQLMETERRCTKGCVLRWQQLLHGLNAFECNLRECQAGQGGERCLNRHDHIKKHHRETRHHRAVQIQHVGE